MTSKKLEDYLYYEEKDPDLKIYCGDCLEIMPLLPRVDLVYADPPFNAKGRIGWYSRNYGKTCSDDLSEFEYSKWCKKWSKLARRITERLCITPGVGNIGHYPNPKWCVVIDKPSSPSFNRMGGFNCWEPFFIYDNPIGRLPRDVIRFDSQNFIRDGREKHPCPDNENMVSWIIQNWSKENEIVCDPFLGSGTTLTRCKELNRNGIGIEISKEFCDLSKKRLQATCKPLFTDVSGATKNLKINEKQSDTLFPAA